VHFLFEASIALATGDMLPYLLWGVRLQHPFSRSWAHPRFQLIFAVLGFARLNTVPDWFAAHLYLV